MALLYVARGRSFARRYQNTETGAMWHEIAQSATYVDWFHRYPYIYRHTDISPLYCFGCATSGAPVETAVEKAAAGLPYLYVRCVTIQRLP